MSVEFVTVADVPIVGTGEYMLASGPMTFSAEQLKDAIAASQDPTVPAPRIKLGHTDDRFKSDELDGEPAFGSVHNLRLSGDGQEIIGDLVDVPSWLAESMASSFPGRSIEGGVNFTAASGRKYGLCISNLALLGTTWPGVSSLADLREVLDRNGKVSEPIAAGDGRHQASAPFVARVSRPGDSEPVEIAAGLDLGSVRMQFCDALDAGKIKTVAGSDTPQSLWWPRSIRAEGDGSLCAIVDDEAGHLIRVPFTVTDEGLSYGDPELVVEQYVPAVAEVAASGRGSRAIASWPVRAASRPSITTEVHLMDIDTAVLRKRFGLADDADDAAIMAALTADPTPVAPDPDPVIDPAPIVPPIPDGMRLIDEQTLDAIREGAEQGVAVAARMATEDRNKVIAAAIGEGRFPPSRREHYERLWEKDTDGTRTLLTASAADGGLAPGLVPAGSREAGHAGDGEGDASDVDRAMDEFMASRFPQAHARTRGNTPGVRVRQEA